MPSIILKQGWEASLQRRHPWIFNGAVQTVSPRIASGEAVDVLSSEGTWLAAGAYSPYSQIQVRVWSFEPSAVAFSQLFRQRLERAVQGRNLLFENDPCSAYRLVYAESDGLPGLIVDRYAGFLVVQFLFAGVEAWKETIVQHLHTLFPAAGIYERSEGEARKKEGLEQATGVLLGPEPSDLIEIREGEVRYLVDIRHGQKTGLFLDQRDNRALIADFSHDAEVLNCFAYTGGFGLWALKANARHVTNIDTSSEALALAQRTVELNGFDATRLTNTVGDVFQVLRAYRDSRRSFDLIVLDPPKFAASVDQVPKASRGYKDINLLALKLLRPGGVLFTFSCSGHIKPDLFQKIVADASLDAGREVQIIHHLNQAPDHPVLLSFPESHYLKGLVCRVW